MVKKLFNINDNLFLTRDGTYPSHKMAPTVNMNMRKFFSGQKKIYANHSLYVQLTTILLTP